MNKTKKQLYEENKKLIEWIQKILQEFGTLQVNDRKISIPIYKNSINSFIDNTSLIEEVVIIPEIKLHKITRQEKEND